MNEALEFLRQYGALVLFAVVFVEQIGLPLPAVPVLIAAGVLAGSGHMSLWTAAGVTVVAALLADSIWYELGRGEGRRILGVLCRIAWEPDSCVRRTEELFVKHGPYSLVAAKFIPGLSTIAPPLAGIVGFSVPLFLLYDGLGAVIWTGSSIGMGYVFSDRIEQALVYADQMTPALLVIVVVALFGYVLYKAVGRRWQLRQVPRITVQELTEKLKATEPPLLIDLRPVADTVSLPGIPGALQMSLEQLALRHGELPRHREVVLYCGCPEDAASVQGALLLHQKGLARVRPLAGGIDEWRRYGDLHAAQDVSVPPIYGLTNGSEPMPC